MTISFRIQNMLAPTGALILTSYSDSELQVSLMIYNIKRGKNQFDWKMTTECVDASSQPVHTKLIRINPIDIEWQLMNVKFLRSLSTETIDTNRLQVIGLKLANGTLAILINACKLPFLP